MYALDIIIIRNAEAAGKEAAIADNTGQHSKAGKIFEADYEARRELARPGIPLALAKDVAEAFVAAYCHNREVK